MVIDFGQIGNKWGVEGKQENKINILWHRLPIQDILVILCCIAVEVWRGRGGSGGKECSYNHHKARLSSQVRLRKVPKAARLPSTK